MDSLDCHPRIGTNLALTSIGAVGRGDNDTWVRNSGDGSKTRFKVAGEEVIEGLETPGWDNVFFHVVVGGSPERLKGVISDGFGGVEECTESFGVFDKPLGECVSSWDEEPGAIGDCRSRTAF
jgi:hypothetical protein